MNCYRCATPIPEHSRFCSSCGALMPDATLGIEAADDLEESADRELEMLLRAETAGEYEILREIGRGAMGVVYLAREITLARDVAMKILPPHLTFGKGAITRFRREARTAAALEHPNIVPVYRVAPGGRLFWYTMKYLEGRSLADVLKEQRTLPLPAAITILERIANALDYAHQRHVIHRDVKPGNVMLETHGHVIVTDFGIAKETATGSQPGTDAIVGTPFYMSPEQCQNGKLTGASDQYSVAVMAYEMLTGRVPFDSSSIVDLLQKHVVEEPPLLHAHSPDLPAHVSEAVERAMAKEPEERFPSVTAFVRAMTGPTSDSTMLLPRVWSIRPRFSRGAGRRVTVRDRRRAIRNTGVTVLATIGLMSAALWWGRRSAVVPAVPPPTASSAAPLAPLTVPVRSAPPGETDARRVERVLLIVQTVGGWARIHVDGGPSHEGTAYREVVAPGRHVIHLEREGFSGIDTIVTTGGRDRVVVRIPLRRAVGATTP